MRRRTRASAEAHIAPHARPDTSASEGASESSDEQGAGNATKRTLLRPLVPKSRNDYLHDSLLVDVSGLPASTTECLFGALRPEETVYYLQRPAPPVTLVIMPLALAVALWALAIVMFSLNLWWVATPFLVLALAWTAYWGLLLARMYFTAYALTSQRILIVVPGVRCLVRARMSSVPIAKVGRVRASSADVVVTQTDGRSTALGFVPYPRQLAKAIEDAMCVVRAKAAVRESTLQATTNTDH